MEKLNEAQIEELERFIEAVDSEGLEYAAQNYPPKSKELRAALGIEDLVDALNHTEETLRDLAEEYGLEYN